MTVLSDFCSALARSAAPSFCLVWSLAAYAPLVVLANNPEELKDVTLAAYGATVGPAAVGCWLGLTLIVALAGKMFRSAFPTVLVLAMTIGVWANVNIFNWNYGALTGQPVDFAKQAHYGWIDAAAWLLFVGTAWFLRSWLAQRSGRSAALILTILLAGLGSLSLEAEKGLRIWQRQDPSPATLTVAAQGNVFVIILDTLQTDIAQEALSLRPDLREKLDGFLFYTNNVGAGTTTVGGAPALLGAGHLIDPNDYLQWRERSLNMKAETFLLKRLAEQNYEICQDGSIGPNTVAAPKCSGEKSADGEFFLLDLGLFRALPHFLKVAIYNRQRWFFSAYGSGGAATLRGTASPYRIDMNTLSTLTRHLRVEPSVKPRFFWLHLMGAHVPILLGADCAPNKDIALPSHALAWQPLVERLRNSESRAAVVAQTLCYLDRVTGLLERLRELQIYNDSVIVLVADHGDSFGHRREHFERQRAANRNPAYIPDAALTAGTPLLAIKPRNGRGPLTERRDPAALCDVPQVILGQLGSRSAESQACLDIVSHSPSPSRVRRFHYYRWTPETWTLGSGNFPDVEELVVVGDALRLESWQPSFARRVQRQSWRPWTNLDMTKPESTRFLSVVGWHIRRGSEQRSTVAVAGAEGRLYFGAELKAHQRLRLRVANLPGQGAVRLALGFAGRTLCRYEVPAGDLDRNLDCSLPPQAAMDHVSLSLSGAHGAQTMLTVREAQIRIAKEN